MQKTADFVICGAGSIGVAIAYYLTQQGHNNFVLVDKYRPLSQTSAKSGENYRDWWPLPAMSQFMSRSIDLMERLALETDNLFNLTRRGYVYASTKTDPAFLAELADIRYHDTPTAINYKPIQADWQNQPLGADILRNQALIGHTFPHFSDEVKTAVHARRCGDLSASQLGMYLLKQAKLAGAVELRGEVVAIEQDSQGVSKVRIVGKDETVEISTRRFINAAGPYAPHVANLLNINLPIFSVFQQKVAFDDPLGIIPRHMPFTIFADPQYLEWDDDERELLESESGYAWLLEEFPGGLHIKPDGGENGTWIKLGWAFNQQPEEVVWKRPKVPEFVDVAVRGAARLVPGLRGYFDNVSKPFSHYGGYYTKTAENLPLIGPLDVAGAYICGAFSGFGTMASCAAGELIAQWITGNELPDYASLFAPSRYTNSRYQTLLKEIGQTGEL
ncbi:MAG: FAD-binding oxidoreductase [Chloroflexota bacterium]